MKTNKIKNIKILFFVSLLFWHPNLLKAEITTDNEIPLIDFSEAAQKEIDQPKESIPHQNESDFDIPLFTATEDISEQNASQQESIEKENKEASIESTEQKEASDQPVLTTETPEQEDELSTTEEAGLGATAIGATGAAGLGLKTLLIDTAKDHAKSKISEKVDEKLSSKENSEKTTRKMKKNIKTQKQLIASRQEQAARKVDYYSKSEKPSAKAKQEKWQNRLERSNELRAKIDRQKELIALHQNPEVSKDQKKATAEEQAKLSKEVLTSEKQRLNARLHKYEEKTEPLSQKQRIKQEQTKDTLKKIETNNQKDLLFPARRGK